MTARATLKDLEAGPLNEANKDHNRTTMDLIVTEAALLKAKEANLVLCPRRVFEYPIDQSISAIDYCISEFVPSAAKDL